MRTLLIDNYDSYTYNLAQLIAEVNGAEPTVVHNDVDPSHLDLDAFDNIVISPGPGHPARADDFGICADVIAKTQVPLLGVCLGHQGIVVGEGGAVDLAPQARHGHLSNLRHDGSDLFAGLPETFTVVRYHSLCAAQPLPPTLIPTAWSEDGVLMALRHRDRPLWGLQFHPESIASRFGKELLTRFRDLTPARSHQPAPARPRPRRSAPVGYRLHVRSVDVAVDTEAAFTALFGSAPQAFWLDSAHVEPGLARFSHLGAGTGPLGELVSYRVGTGAVTVTSNDAPPRQVPGTIFDYLDAELARRRADQPDLPFDPPCGYVGYFGYELKADCGATARHRSANPDAQWIFADRTVTVDHEQGRTYVVALGEGNEEWLAEAVDTLTALPAAQPVRISTADEAPIEPWLVRDRAQYLADIEACQRKLHDGESYELCLTNSARVPALGDGFAFYQRLRRGNPAPYGAYLTFPDLLIACSSPERFLRIDRDRQVETKPIKGTIRRGRDEAEDALLKAELTSSTKNFAENLMILDLLRNDLGRVCEVASVRVPRMMVAETYATMHQLVSTVRGRLRAEVSAVDCVRACFPGGSMTGAPKLRSMEILDALETTARGVYSGSIGVLGVTGTADLNIVIRTAVRTGDEWQVGAGGAIVLDSDPAEEYAEMLLKAEATLRAAQVGAL